MKTLQESLFDFDRTQMTTESLFDNNLSNKSLPLRDVYMVARRKGLEITGMSAFPLFSLSKLEKFDPNNEHLIETNYSSQPFFVRKILSIIMDSPIPQKSDFGRSSENGAWAKELKKKLTKFIKPDQKYTWSRTNIWVEDDNDMIIIDINIENGIGITRLRFEPIK